LVFGFLDFQKLWIFGLSKNFGSLVFGEFQKLWIFGFLVFPKTLVFWFFGQKTKVFGQSLEASHGEG